jgi:hypothetical protein
MYPGYVLLGHLGAVLSSNSGNAGLPCYCECYMPVW